MISQQRLAAQAGSSSDPAEQFSARELQTILDARDARNAIRPGQLLGGNVDLERRCNNIPTPHHGIDRGVKILLGKVNNRTDARAQRYAPDRESDGLELRAW